MAPPMARRPIHPPPQEPIPHPPTRPPAHPPPLASWLLGTGIFLTAEGASCNLSGGGGSAGGALGHPGHPGHRASYGATPNDGVLLPDDEALLLITSSLARLGEP